MSKHLKLNFKAELFNPIYAEWLKSELRYKIAYGSRDSGKSYVAAQYIVLEMLGAFGHGYCKVVLLRRHYNTIKDSQFQTILDIIDDWKLGSLFKSTTSPLEIVCIPTKNKCLARGLDKPATLKSVKDPTLVWAEEADEIGLDAFVKSDLSLRTSYRDSILQWIITFNPENEETSWINDRFFPAKSTYEKDDGRFHYIESPESKAIIIHTTYEDNPWCSEDRRQIYEDLRHSGEGETGNYYRVYAKGLWGNALDGQVLTNIEHADDMPGIEDCKYYSFALDFGFTNDPTAILECALAHGKIYLQEHCYRRGLVNVHNPIVPSQGSIQKELERLQVGKTTVICDSAEPKSIQELRNCGFQVVGVKKPKGSINQGISKLQEYPIVLVGGSSNLRKEVRSYVWAKDKEGNSTNKPIDAWNHGIDAARYFVLHYLFQGSASSGNVVFG
jgi:phage terminase large subunit